MGVQTNIAATGYGNTYLDSLISGYAWADPGVNPIEIRYAFAEGTIRSEGGIDGAGLGWLDYEMLAFYRAIDSYEAVCNVNFVEYGNYAVANILWYSIDESVLPAGDSIAMHGYPDSTTSQVYGFFWADATAWAYLSPGGRGYNAIVHEIGHGLGLEHPHRDDDPAMQSPTYAPFPGVDSDSDRGDNALNQGIWTIMSYVDGWDEANTDWDSGNAITPMAFDIAALQRMYGANMNYHAGDDSYFLGPTWDTAGNGWRCIWDAGGSNDTLSAIGTDANAHLDLRAATLAAGDPNAGGYVSYYFTGTGASRRVLNDVGYTIANGVVIENAIGGLGNDELIGNFASNKLTGGAGGDTLNGGGGYDFAIYDTVDYLHVLTIDMLNPGKGTFDAAGDVFISIEAVWGSPTDDRIYGTDGVEALSGRDGWDYLYGRGGADVLDGGGGNDVAGYTTGVRADLMFTYLNTGEAAGDSYTSIEGLAGSDVQDDLRGDDFTNWLYGNGGADVIRGRGGNDAIEGGTGHDTLYGDGGHDDIYGDSGNDRLEGSDGDDFLSGGSGVDTMIGGIGNDIYIVDNVADVVIENANEGNDTLLASLDTYTLAEGASIEELHGDDSWAVTLRGNSAANNIYGGFSNNKLYGNGGDDTINGWLGDDTVDGGDGNDLVKVGNMLGFDSYVGGDGIDTLDFYYDFDSGFEFNLALGVLVFQGVAAGGEPFTIGSITWSGFEQVIGGSGEDTITGDRRGNRLDGDAGSDELHGQNGSDVLAGGLGFDAMYGEEGNDTLVGIYEYNVFGLDFMDGGEGDDTADFSAHSLALWIDLAPAPGGTEVWTRDWLDVVTGDWRQVANLESVEHIIATDSYDHLLGSSVANRIDAGSGNDYLDGRDGNDTLIGGYGYDSLYGGLGNDTFIASYEFGLASDYVDGGTGFDTVDYSQHGKAVWIDLTAAKNKVWTTNGTSANTGTLVQIATLASVECAIGSSVDDRLIGNTAANTLVGGGGNDTLVGGDGTDTAEYAGLRTEYGITRLADGSLQIVDQRAGGNEGTDILTGVERLRFSDVTFTTSIGTSGNETMTGTDFADWLVGGLGNDKLYGGLAGDLLEGGDGNDRLDGQDGNDTMIGGAGADTFAGGTGLDTVDYSGGAAVIADLSNATAAGGAAAGDTFAGVEHLIGSINADQLRGTTAANKLDGGRGADFLSGNAGADTLLGGDGTDTLEGGAANDSIDGGAGNDTITGGAGYDNLTGGGGADTFVFNGKTDQRDTITDFAGIDILALSAAGFGITNLANVDFIAGATTKAGAGPALLYNTTTGQLSFDADGLGGTASFAFAILTGAPTLGIDDFLLV